VNKGAKSCFEDVSSLSSDTDMSPERQPVSQQEKDHQNQNYDS
jgi:hypothetical protein